MSSLVKRATRKVYRIFHRKIKSCKPVMRVGIIGCGTISQTHLQGFESTRDSKVVAVSDLSAEPLARMLDDYRYLRGYISYQQMLEDVKPDIVSICTWPQSHAAIGLDCARAGVRGILCEKPLALQKGEIENMLQVCQRSSTKLGCGHQYRFHPVFVAARDALASGRIGKIVHVEGVIRGSLANNGPHLIDTVRFLLNDPRVHAVESVCNRIEPLEERGLPCEATASSSIFFDGDITCHVETGSADPKAFQILVKGSTGELVVTPRTLHINGKAEKLSGDFDAQCRAVQFGKFTRWVSGKDRSYLASGTVGAESAEIVLACYESIRTGNAVQLPLDNLGNVVADAFPDWMPPDTAPGATVQHPIYRAKNLALAGGERRVPKWYSEQPTMGMAELKNLAYVIQSKRLNRIGGQMVPALEERSVEVYGGLRAVSSTSGTSAIHVALGALELEPGDEVITTPLTDMGSVIPILACCAVPVFADVDSMTGILTAETIAAQITPKTRAVILVHLFGRPAEITPIAEMLEARGIALIEDCAQAHLAEYRGKNVGTIGDFGCFSLQQSKQITCGDGGITLINRPEYIEKAALFIDKGWKRGQGKTGHLRLGMNYRMTELQAAVALAQLDRLPILISKRRKSADDLYERLSRLPGIELPPCDSNIRSSWWKFLFRIGDSRVDAGEFYRAARVEGIRMSKQYLSRPLFEEPVISGPCTFGASGFPFTISDSYTTPRIEDFPGFRAFNERWLQLNWSSHVTSYHVDCIARAVGDVLEELRRPAQNREIRPMETINAL